MTTFWNSKVHFESKLRLDEKDWIKSTWIKYIM